MRRLVFDCANARRLGTARRCKGTVANLQFDDVFALSFEPLRHGQDIKRRFGC